MLIVSNNSITFLTEAGVINSIISFSGANVSLNGNLLITNVEYNTVNSIANGSSSAMFNLQNANYTIALTDMNKVLYHNISQSNTFSINTAANVPIPLGASFVVVNGSASGNVNIAPVVGVTLRTSNTTLSGNCNVVANGICTVYKVELNTWVAERA